MKEDRNRFVRAAGRAASQVAGGAGAAAAVVRDRPHAMHRRGRAETPASTGMFYLLASMASRPVLAHVESGEAGGLLQGLLHPVTGLDHVLAMVAVGLWGAQLGAPAVWLLPVTFPVVMAFGGMLGLIGVGLPGVEIGIALSGLLLGLAVLAAWRPPLAACAMLVGVFAIFHGHAHGTELPEGQNALLYSLGFVVSTGTLHAIGIAIGLVHRYRWGEALLRAAGALIAAGGLFFLWQALA